MRSSNTSSSNSSFWYYYNRKWKLFRATLILLKHQDNLEGLIDWSKRKKLSGVNYYYRRLLQGVYKRLDSIVYESSAIVELARWFYCASEMLFPPTYSKGFASQYSKKGQNNYQ